MEYSLRLHAFLLILLTVTTKASKAGKRANEAAKTTTSPLQEVTLYCVRRGSSMDACTNPAAWTLALTAGVAKESGCHHCSGKCCLVKKLEFNACSGTC
mmetsp:Transcript_67229/g.132614  ORF Transcript_67229/g.132614 Transcript_67229/m.132614 type:complete len:99 (-) Transcript_67229:2217-2513(-)